MRNAPVYTQGNCRGFENEKTLIDRMVTRLKQLLEHVRPWEPDDKEYVPFDKFNGYDDILYDVYYQGILEIMRDDAITSRNTADQRRIMHAIILATLSKQKLIASDPQSSPWFYWTSCQQRYASQKRMHSTQGFSSEAWMPIETLTSTDTSFTPLETGEIDVNKGGVALLKERFPLRSVPTYIYVQRRGKFQDHSISRYRRGPVDSVDLTCVVALALPACMGWADAGAAAAARGVWRARHIQLGGAPRSGSGSQSQQLLNGPDDDGKQGG